jgi:hypothetical protein
MEKLDYNIELIRGLTLISKVPNTLASYLVDLYLQIH